MKSGELLLNINTEDIKHLYLKALGLEYNKLCPFAEYLKDEDERNADINQIKALTENKDAMFLIKYLAKPLSLLQFRIGGPKEKYLKLSVCKIDDSKFILVLFNGNSFGIQYYENKTVLAEILDSLVINSDAEGGNSFPDIPDFESLLLYLGIIDSFRYIKYRDSLNHHNSTLNRITSDEFQKVMKDSIEKLDINWLVSNLMYLVPSATKFEIKGNVEKYDELFNNGYLLSVADKNTNEGYLLLDVKACELGAEFLELWYKSAGIQISYLKDGVVETHPSAFITVTGIANHSFLFEEGSDKIIYRNYIPMVTPNIFVTLLDKLVFEKSIIENKHETKPRFCGKCGAPIAEGAKFCGKCGNNI